MKVLIISHVPISTQFNMGKTFISLFSSFQKTELCQFYIYPTIPDVDVCSSFYRITDKDVLKSYYRFRVLGDTITANANVHRIYEHENDEKIYSNPKNKNDARMILRDLMWRFANWHQKDFRKWIDKEAPTCIFVAPGPAAFLYDIALAVAKKRKIPIVSYICDDYYFVNPPNSFLGRLRVFALKRKIGKLMKHTSAVVAISDALATEYSREFSVVSKKLMTGSDFLYEVKPKAVEHPTNISYFGNIRCNRYYSLADIGIALDHLNNLIGTDFRLVIYTSEKDQDIVAVFRDIKSVELRPFVSGECFREALLRSHILLHVEAFDELSRETVKYSVSTKIADSLACGIPLFAYAPATVSSMKHLIDNECAIVATSKDELEDILLKAFLDRKLRESVVSKAFEVAKKYHDNKKNSDLLKQICMDTEKANDEPFTKKRVSAAENIY